ncbi:Fic family protein [Cellulomonas sp. NS3]|uniref:Fic family protein n=1 Tax=Cellulomonas sp. NS3 TaxID=2973977 RepID=UPI002162C08F|nr:Fic family protein [Cellulomonas sp. NS3]
MHEPAAPRTSADDPLAGLAALPGVAEAVDAARRACEELRWHEAYRRRWREVRAEAGLRSARGSAALDGARVPLDVVRALAVGAGAGSDPGPGDPARPELAPAGAGHPERARPGHSGGAAVDRSAPDVAVATGALRAAAEVERLMPGLGARGAAALPPFGQLAARLHAAAGRGWVADDDLGRLRTDQPPLDLRGLGAAPSGPEVAARLDLLGRVLRETRVPAVVVAAVVHGEVLALRPFVAGNGLVARALSRLVLTSRGLDPTGSLVPEHTWAGAPNPYLSAAAGFATGTPDGLAGWVAFCARGAVGGAREARAVADAVLAGRFPTDG